MQSDGITLAATLVFLGLMLHALVQLYAATKDRWRWKRIAFGAVTIPLSLCGLVIGALWFYQPRPEPPHAESQFWDLRLGMSDSDVTFRKGNPSDRMEPSGKEAEESSAKEPKLTWIYEPPAEKTYEPHYLVTLRSNKVTSIMAHRLSGSSISGPSIQGIFFSSTQEAIEERFGQPDHTHVSKDKLRRTLTYERFNVVFMLEKNAVDGIGIYDPAVESFGFSIKVSAN